MRIIDKAILISIVSAALLIQEVNGAENLQQEAPKAYATREALVNDPRVGDQALENAIEHVMPRNEHDRIMCKHQFTFKGSHYDLADFSTKSSIVRQALLNGEPLLGSLCQSYAGRNGWGVKERLTSAINDRLAAEKDLRRKNLQHRHLLLLSLLLQLQQMLVDM